MVSILKAKNRFSSYNCAILLLFKPRRIDEKRVGDLLSAVAFFFLVSFTSSCPAVQSHSKKHCTDILILVDGTPREDEEKEMSKTTFKPRALYRQHNVKEWQFQTNPRPAPPPFPNTYTQTTHVNH